MESSETSLPDALPDNTSVDAEAFVNELIDALHEVDEKPQRQIRLIVEYCGIPFAREILQATFETEAAGGMMLPDESRRRTIGGVYFYLARRRMTHQLQKRIFPYNSRKPQSNIMPAPPYPALVWDQRVPLLQSLLESHGEVYNVKVTLIGRPGRIETRKDLVVTTMVHEGKSPTNPRGLPPMPEAATVYTVYISAKQWKRVEQAITHPDDALIIEGICAFDPAINAIAVYAHAITTQRMEKRKRAKAETDSLDNAGNAVSAAARPPVSMKPSRLAEALQTVAAVPDPLMDVSIPPNVPADETEKLMGLYSSARAYRQKIANLEAQPEGQRFGLEITKKLLKKVEDEIAAVEKRYAG